MPHPRSARSDMSDADMEGLQEQELVKLQRTFRNMEGDRSAYTEESQNMIRKQKYINLLNQIKKKKCYIVCNFVDLIINILSSDLLHVTLDNIIYNFN